MKLSGNGKPYLRRLLAVTCAVLCGILLFVSCEEMKPENEFKYDENGNMIEQIMFDQFGRPAGRSTYEYDENNRMTVQWDYDEADNLTQSHRCEYDENGKESRITTFDAAENVMDVTVFEYDAAGNMIKQSAFDAAGTLLEYFSFEYDDEGQMIRSAQYDGKGNYLGGSEFEYYGDGSPLKTTSYGKDGVIQTVNEYYPGGKTKSYLDYIDGKPYKGQVFDEAGNTIREIDNSADFVFPGDTPNPPPPPEDEPEEPLDEQFDEQGRLIRRDVVNSSGHREATEYTYDKKGNFSTVTTYDEKGNAVEQKTFNGNGNLIGRRLMTYDAVGNQTEVLTLDEAGNPLSRTVRLFQENGYQLEEREYRGMDELLSRTTFAYYPNGNVKNQSVFGADGLLTEEWEYLESGEFVSHTRFRYRQDGRIESTQIIDESGVVIQTLHYDEAGHRIGTLEETFYPNGNVHTRKEGLGAGETVLRTFDEQGNVTEECWFNEKGEQTSRYTTTYDEAGRELDYLSYDARNKLTGGKRRSYFSDGTVKSDQLFTVRDGKERILSQSELSDDRRNYVSTSYSEDGTVLAQIIRTLDENGRILCEKEYYESKGVWTEQRYEYYPSGQWRTSTRLVDGKTTTVMKYEDCCDYPVEVLEYGNDGKEILQRYVNVYDAAGRILSQKEYKGRDELRVHMEYVYNAAGKLVTQKEYNEKDELWKRTENIYNDAGTLLEQQEYDGAGRLIRLCFYNENGLQTRLKHFGETGDLLDETVIEYHPNGWVKERSYYVAGVLREYFTYDENGYPLVEKYY